MLKPGVWTRSSFLSAPPSGAISRFLRRLAHSRVSLHLLRIPDPPSTEDIALFERLMPYVRLSSGVYRTTYRQRFRALNPIVNTVLLQSFSASRTLHVEDWAASDCLTSAEWAEELIPLFPHLDFVASDLLLFLVEAKRNRNEERFILEPDGTPLQYVRPPFVVRLSQPEPKVFFFNWLLARKALKRWKVLRSDIQLPGAGSLPDDSVAAGNGWEVRKLSLVHPEALKLAKGTGRFSIRRHSAFDRADRPCDVVRTMNIYNRAYFSEERLREGVRAVLGSLTSDGIWIVGRTAEESGSAHNVTVFRKGETGSLVVLKRVGNGSEIEELAMTTSQSNAEKVVPR